MRTALRVLALGLALAAISISATTIHDSTPDHHTSTRPPTTTTTSPPPDDPWVQALSTLAAQNAAREAAWYATAARRAEEAAAARRRVLEESAHRPASTPRTTGCPAPIADAIRAAFGAAGEWAVGIAWRESNCRPEVRSRDGAIGLFQLLGHGDLANGCSLYDASCNIAAAVRLYNGGRGACHWQAPRYCAGT